MFVQIERKQCEELIELIEMRIGEIRLRREGKCTDEQSAKLGEELHRLEELLHCLHEAEFDVTA